nr:GNAT family N-acetyltransferase [Bacteroidota bacterium]
KFTRRYISSPAGTFGGWLAATSLDQRQQTALMRFIIGHYSDLNWRFNPYEKMLFVGEIGCMTEEETLALDLSIGFEEIYHSWTKGHASAARKARKVGVEISIAETQSDWENYFTVYEDSLNRWGENTTLSYSWTLFETIMRRASPDIKLWLARYEGLVIAGALCFYSPTHVVYWHGAALSSHFNLRPVNLLMYEAIHDAAERGFKWFDFNPSGGLDGVRAFKRSFGAQSIESNVMRRSSLLVSSVATAVKILRKFVDVKFDS